MPPPPPIAPPVLPSTETYNLRWGDFHVNLCDSLSELRSSEDLLDVTLCLDGDRSLRAHQVILSASSPYFRSVLRRHGTKGSSNSNNLVLLMPPATRYSDLALLLHFVYTGEVSVNQCDIDSFMELAKSLKIKGLTNSSSFSGEEDNKAPAGRMKAPLSPKEEPPLFNSPPKQPQPRGPSKRPRYSATPEGGGGVEKNLPPHPADRPFFREQPPTEFYSEAESGRKQQGLNTGTTLMGLICPSCRTLCQDVPALKDHMAHACPASLPQQQHEAGGSPVEPPLESSALGGGEYVPGTANACIGEPPVLCNICDKSFKNQKNMLMHQKRQHKSPDEGPTPKKRGRPSKKVVMQEEEQENYLMNPQGGDLNNIPLESHMEPPPIVPRVPPPRGPQRSFKKGPNKGPPKAMDLQKIGQKLGGQISITSSENDETPLSSNSSNNKLTITKLKGDHPVGSPLSIKEATTAHQVQVKEEPSEDYGNGGEYMEGSGYEEDEGNCSQEGTYAEQEEQDGYGDSEEHYAMGGFGEEDDDERRLNKEI